MYFDRIKGHEDVLSFLRKQLSNNDLEGVYLFNGPRAVGKYTVARQLSKYLLCTGTSDDSCRCENCRLFPHVPDFLEISLGDDIIKVSDVEPLENFLSLVPYRSRRRVVLIDNAENMNSASANDTLKLLEDMSADAVVILVSGNPDRLLPTIRSRAYDVRFESLSADETVEVLKGLGHKSGLIDDFKKSLQYFSGDALQDFVRYTSYMKSIPKFLRDFPNMDEDDMLTMLGEIDQKEELLYFVEVFSLYLDDLLKIKYDSPDVVFNVKALDEVEASTSVWRDELCITANEKLKAVMHDYHLGLNLKLKHLLFPAMIWIYLYMQKENKKSAAD